MRTLFDERTGEIRNMSKENDCNNLTYHYKTPGVAPINFLKYKCQLKICNNIKNGDITIEKIKMDQIKFKSDSGLIKSGNPKNRVKGQISIIENI